MEAPETSDIEQHKEAKQAREQVGQVLRAARLERGLDIEDVARQLRFAVRQVTALEEDEYDKLAGGTFLRGFVRNYAKLLQLDEAPLLQLLEQSVPPPAAHVGRPPSEEIPFPSGREDLKRNLIIGGGIVLALTLLVYAIYSGDDATVAEQPGVAMKPEEPTEQMVTSFPFAPRQTPAAEGSASQPPAASAFAPDTAFQLAPGTVPPQEATPSVDGGREQDAMAFAHKDEPAESSTEASARESLALPSSPAPTQQSAPAASAVSGAGSANVVAAQNPGHAGAGIHLTFDGESWAEVKDGSGKLLLSRVNPPGSEQVLRGEPPYSLTIGNPSQVKLVYNNRPVDLVPFTNLHGGTAHLVLE